MEGEGEETWKEYLDYRLKKQGTLSMISGLVYRNEEGKIQRNTPRKPLDLDKLPFVYESLEGLSHKILYYEASRGCPFNCQYCLSSAIKGLRYFSIDRVKRDLKNLRFVLKAWMNIYEKCASQN